MTRERMSQAERDAVEACLDRLAQGVRDLAARLDALKAELSAAEPTA